MKIKLLCLTIIYLTSLNIFGSEMPSDAQEAEIKKAKNAVPKVFDNKFIDVTDLIKHFAGTDKLPKYVFANIDPVPYVDKTLLILYTGEDKVTGYHKPWDNPPEIQKKDIEKAVYGYFTNNNLTREQFLNMISASKVQGDITSNVSDIMKGVKRIFGF